MVRFRFAPLGLLLLVGAAEAEAPLQLPLIDYVLVRKAERTMTLYSEGQAVHTIAGIQLGDEPVGPKRFQGDERTPEGAYARAQGRSPGGQIFIHGQPNDWPVGRVPGDWTDGCIAVSNEEMEALWEAVPNGTVIDILP